MLSSPPFSCPAQAGLDLIKNNWNVDQLDYLIVSHPHLDHIRDISNIQQIPPKVLFRRHIDLELLISEEYKRFERIIREYVEFEQRYQWDITPDVDPKKWSVSFKNFVTTVTSENVNDMGVATFITYGGFTLLQPGDLEKEGWENLLTRPDFTGMLRKTNFLIASHHGRRSGYFPARF